MDTQRGSSPNKGINICNHFTIGLKYKRMVRGMKCVVQLPQGNNSKREKRKSMKEREGKTIAIRGEKRKKNRVHLSQNLDIFHIDLS